MSENHTPTTSNIPSTQTPIATSTTPTNRNAPMTPNTNNAPIRSTNTIPSSQSKHITIADIDGANYGKILQARISMMWFAFNTKREPPTTISRDMLLIDKQGNTIHARIMSWDFTKVKEKYWDMLKEGEIYNIFKFTTTEIQKIQKYRMTAHNFQIYMDGNTAVQHVTTNISDIATHSFNFVQYDDNFNLEIQSNNIYLIDIIGKVTAWNTMGKKCFKLKTKDMRTITIQNESGKELRVELLEDIGKQIDDEATKNRNDPAIFVITSTIVRDENGMFYVQSSSATKIYQNLDIPETREILNSTSTTDLEIKEAEQMTQEEIDNIIFKDRKTLLEINAERLNKKPGVICNQEKYYTCSAEITKVHDEWDWKYEGCPKFKTRIYENMGEYYCQKCNTNTKPYQCCSIHVELTDDYDEARVIIFGDGLRDLLEKNIETMINKNQQKINYSTELKKLIGKKALFTIKIDQKSRDNKRASLAVSSVNQINEEHEIRYAEKRKREEQQEEFINNYDYEELIQQHQKKSRV